MLEKEVKLSSMVLESWQSPRTTFAHLLLLATPHPFFMRCLSVVFKLVADSCVIMILLPEPPEYLELQGVCIWFPWQSSLGLLFINHIPNASLCWCLFWGSQPSIFLLCYCCFSVSQVGLADFQVATCYLSETGFELLTFLSRELWGVEKRQGTESL